MLASPCMQDPAFGEARARANTIPIAATKQDQSPRPIVTPCSLGRAQLPNKRAVGAAQGTVVVSVGGIVAVADEVGDGGVAQHASPVGQRRATEAQHLTAGEVDVD